MNLPDLNNTERMARVGRLAVLKSERRKAAEILRNALIPIINNTGRSINLDSARKLLSDIEMLDGLINKEEAKHDGE